MSRPLKPQWDLLQERMKSKQRHDVKLPNQKVFEKFQPGNQVVVQDPKSKEWSLRGKDTQTSSPAIVRGESRQENNTETKSATAV